MRAAVRLRYRPLDRTYPLDEIVEGVRSATDARRSATSS
jgi:hypothetical protein